METPSVENGREAGKALETAEALADASLSPEADSPHRLRFDATLIGLGWFGTALATGVAGLPFRYLLKDRLGLDAAAVSAFFALANIPIYIKPIAGILSDSFPLFGTRRRHYLLWSLFLGALGWALLGLVPPTYQTLLWTYLLLNIFLVLTSTVLGGLMVEVGIRHRATGRLSAQRVGIVRCVGLVTGPVGGFLVQRYTGQAFFVTMCLCAALHFALLPLFQTQLREAPVARFNPRILEETKRQFLRLFSSRTLWSAAGLVFLVIISPGFGTPLFYYQTNTLRFSPQLIGNLAVLDGIGGLAGAFLYGFICRHWNLRWLLALSIGIHILGTLLFLAYRSPVAALIITGVSGMTQTLAVLPLYDLAARATPKGAEALGYSVMMSVWNFTNALSDLLGSWLFKHFALPFVGLVWLNAGTTALVLLAVPFLPRVLMNRRDGEASN